MRLRKLLSRAGIPWPEGGDEKRNPEILALSYDSRRVGPGSLFFAVPGLQTDGYHYVEAARAAGAVAILSQREAALGFPLPWVRVECVRRSMARLADLFHGSPSHSLDLVATTGTNGKTTVSYLVHAILDQRAPALLMGTVTCRLAGREMALERTTPEAVDIQALLAQALEEGCRRGALEVSSHALYFERVRHCRFPVAVFTNLSQDHLDFHGNLEEYFQVKSRLFDPKWNPGLRCAVINGDDPFGRRLATAPGVDRIRYGFQEELEVHPLEQETSTRGTRLALSLLGRRLRLESALAGEHNLYNIMAAAAAAAALGAGDEEIRAGIRALERVPGRFERVEIGRPFTVIVDYAHTPHALENVLRLGRKLTARRLLCVFGCGGDRDRAKRPQMGAIAVRLADHAILTSDNPRSEDPEAILREIRSGIPETSRNWESILERRRAIERALEMAAPGDLVLVAGKGHEQTQEIGGRRLPFDDREVVRELA